MGMACMIYMYMYMGMACMIYDYMGNTWPGNTGMSWSIAWTYGYDMGYGVWDTWIIVVHIVPYR